MTAAELLELVNEPERLIPSRVDAATANAIDDARSWEPEAAAQNNYTLDVSGPS